MNSLSQGIRAWLPSVLVAAAIFFGSSRSVTLSVSGASAVLLAVGFHMTEFALLALAVRRGLRLSGVRALTMGSFLIAMAYAVTDEIHQSFTPGRSPSMLDLIPDALGAILALALFNRFQHRANGVAS